MRKGKAFSLFLLFIFGGVVLGFAGLTTMIVDYIIITNTDLYPPFHLELIGFIIFYAIAFPFLFFFFLPIRKTDKPSSF